jgi:homocysteine S-methyltransferase
VRSNPIAPFIHEHGVLVLDGGLATTLESAGFELDGALWSARILAEAPAAIGTVHQAFLVAGADCIIAASYQASIRGFMNYGSTEAEAVEQLQRSVLIARDARDAYWEGAEKSGRIRPLVAASIGPFGATRSDGSEYTGDYGLSLETLIEFHRQRWQLLAQAGPDLMACETIPSSVEVDALLTILEATPQVPAWMSLSCKDDAHLNDGTPLVEVAARCDGTPGLLSIGVNCTAPDHVSGLIGRLREATDLPIVVYPNAGGCYDASVQHWAEPAQVIDWTTMAPRWHREGARLIGGCCRVDPDAIRSLRCSLEGEIEGEPAPRSSRR